MTEQSESIDRDPTHSKVGRLVDDYGIGEVGDELAERWSQGRMSLRELAEYFNQQLLREELRRAGINHIEGEVENMYRLLTDDDVSTGVRTEVESTLRQQDVDPDELVQSFVSHQAVHTYLTKYRGVTQESTKEPPRIEKTDQALKRLQSRTKAVAEKNLDDLRETGRLTLGSFTVFVNTEVFCEECGRQFDTSELLDRKGCDCARQEPPG